MACRVTPYIRSEKNKVIGLDLKRRFGKGRTWLWPTAKLTAALIFSSFPLRSPFCLKRPFSSEFKASSSERYLLTVSQPYSLVSASFMDLPFFITKALPSSEMVSTLSKELLLRASRPRRIYQELAIRDQVAVCSLFALYE